MLFKQIEYHDGRNVLAVSYVELLNKRTNMLWFWKSFYLYLLLKRFFSRSSGTKQEHSSMTSMYE
jgi:hypothetical protein